MNNITIPKSPTSTVCSYYNTSKEDMREAVEVIRKMGYITEEEAYQLSDHRCARRNEFTLIYLNELQDSFNIYCVEDISYTQSEVLFDILYDKRTGNITERY